MTTPARPKRTFQIAVGNANLRMQINALAQKLSDNTEVVLVDDLSGQLDRNLAAYRDPVRRPRKRQDKLTPAEQLLERQRQRQLAGQVAKNMVKKSMKKS